MAEQIQTRVEHSRSIEDAEKFRAIQTLTEVGMLVPLSELETFHGRLGSTEGAAEWSVDAGFANGSNDSGNRNVNSRPSLYTGDKAIANDFAHKRATEIVRAKFNSFFTERVENYTGDERQEWLTRENKVLQERYESIDPSVRQDYKHLLGEDGKVKLKSLGDLRVWREARRLERGIPQEERDAIWKAAAGGLRVEVHEIISADSDATVLDLGFDATHLNEDEKKRYNDALNVLFRQTLITEGSPVSFNDREATEPFASTLNRHKKQAVLLDEVSEIAAEAGINEQVALQLCSAYNAGQFARVNPSYLVQTLLKNKDDIIVDILDVAGKEEEVPVNLEYVQRYLRNAHIVGVKQSVDSATLGRGITAVSFLDLEKTTTHRGQEAQRAAMWQALGGMATAFSERANNNPTHEQQPLLSLLTDAYAKPDKLVAAAKQVEGYEAIFDADAGNWEGFTLAEHTETVLRNFEESYADKLPVELLAPMRLAILIHDVGKPTAASQGAKHRQKDYNVAYAGDFLTKLGVGENLKGLLLAMIGDGEHLAFQIDVRKAGDLAETAMNELASHTLNKFKDTGEATQAEIEGFTQMCKILQVCDGGAYTSMAVTRATKGMGRYRNAPSFNESFAQPLGFGKRTVSLRGRDEKHAANDLTPQITEKVSQLKNIAA